MPIEFVEHTADVRIRVRSETLEGLFLEALRGTMALLQPVVNTTAVERHLDVRAIDGTALLVDFLNEALSSAHAYGETYDRVAFAALEATHVEATLRGVGVDSFAQDVKAVTYHEAHMACVDGEWETMLVFDI